MKLKKFEDISLLLVVITATIIGLLRIFGFIDNVSWMNDRISSFVLVLLGLLTTYLINSNIAIKNSVASFEEHLIDSKEQLLVSLKGIESRVYYDAEEAFLHLTKVIKRSKFSIDQIAISPTPQLQDDVLYEYVKSLHEILHSNKVKYRYVAEDSYKPRWDRLVSFSQNERIQKFYLRYFKANTNHTIVPMLNFFIFDNEEIFMRYPHEPGQPEMYLLIKQQDIVKLFNAYYAKIWEAATPYP